MAVFWMGRSRNKALAEENRAMREAMDAIWRLTNLPFTDTDRHRIQGIAIAFAQGGPKPGSQVTQWLADLAAPDGGPQ